MSFERLHTHALVIPLVDFFIRPRIQGIVPTTKVFTQFSCPTNVFTHTPSGVHCLMVLSKEPEHRRSFQTTQVFTPSSCPSNVLVGTNDIGDLSLLFLFLFFYFIYLHVYLFISTYRYRHIERDPPFFLHSFLLLLLLLLLL